MYNVKTAGCIIIGNELMTGRTKDSNMHYLAVELFKNGIDLMEARHIRDIEADIISAINEVRAKYDYIFTSGGIGPTHDDITTESIAKAFDKPVTLNPEAEKLLKEYYGNKITDTRLKMARMPEDSKLITNPLSTAPGFNIENVYVMAGVPSIFQAMLGETIPSLNKGTPIKSVSHVFNIPESDLAKPLQEIAIEYEKHGVDIGSYPRMEGNSWIVEIVVRARDNVLANDVMQKIISSFSNIIPSYYNDALK